MICTALAILLFALITRTITVTFYAVKLLAVLAERSHHRQGRVDWRHADVMIEHPAFDGGV